MCVPAIQFLVVKELPLHFPILHHLRSRCKLRGSHYTAYVAHIPTIQPRNVRMFVSLLLCYGNSSASSSPYRDEASHVNSATTIPSRTISTIETVFTTLPTLHCTKTMISASTIVTKSSKATTSSLGPESTTPDGICGNVSKSNNNGYVGNPGACRSKYGSCGTTSNSCAAPVCQSEFGKCDAPPGTVSVIPDGTLGNIQKGNNKGHVCKTGMCCPKHGNCGTSSEYLPSPLAANHCSETARGQSVSILQKSHYIKSLHFR